MLFYFSPPTGANENSRVKCPFCQSALLLFALGLTSVSAATYTVVKGDSMWKIVVKYQVGLDEIKTANPQTTPQAVVNAWMNSAGHRANILNASYTHIGVGYAAEGNYWTQMFIGK